KAGEVHFLWCRRGIQAIQTTKDTFTYFRIDLRRSPLLPKFGERLALEASDHAVGQRKPSADNCQRLAYASPLRCVRSASYSRLQISYRVPRSDRSPCGEADRQLGVQAMAFFKALFHQPLTYNELLKDIGKLITSPPLP